MTNQAPATLSFRSDIVWPWGLFFSELGEYLSGEIPSLTRVKIEFVLGDFLTPPAISAGEADVGFVTPPACVWMAYRGTGPFTKKMENLRAIAALPHDDRMMWAVPADSPIRSIRDMKAHPLRLVIPSEDFPVRFAVERILEACGTSVADLRKSGWEIIEESHCLKIPTVVLEGRADALVHEGRKTPAWIELGRKRAMRYLPIEEPILKDLETRFGFRRAILPAGNFLGLDADTPCVDFADWLLFTRDDVSEDLIYRMTKIIVEDRKKVFEFHFRNIPEEACNLTCPIDPLELWRNIGGIPLHKGAERYYREHGYL
jgi:TRAP transporter TAXI family solute receptor